MEHATAKLARKGCDWIVPTTFHRDGVMGGDENEIALVTASGVERWPRMRKARAAESRRRVATALA